MTRPNQGLSTGRRDNLGTRLFQGVLDVRQLGSVKRSTNCAKKRRKKEIADFSPLSLFQVVVYLNTETLMFDTYKSRNTGLTWKAFFTLFSIYYLMCFVFQLILQTMIVL